MLFEPTLKLSGLLAKLQTNPKQHIAKQALHKHHF